jgi:Secretion system C-terminal sorting domain
MKESLYLLINAFLLSVILTFCLSKQLNAQEIGINVNKMPIGLDPDLLERCKTKWIRASLDFFWIYTGENTEEDLGWDKFIQSSEAGYNTILTLRWDWKREDLDIPLPNSVKESEYFDFLDNLLDKYAKHAKIIVVNNEPVAESKPEDKEFNITFDGVPAAVFHQKLAEHLNQYLIDNSLRNDIKLFGGSVFQMYKEGWQTDEVNQRIIAYTDQSDILDGLDLHLHVDKIEQIESGLKFVRNFTEKPILVTEYGMVFAYQKNLEEPLGIDNNGKAFAQKYGRDENMVLFDYFNFARKNTISFQEWADFNNSRSWYPHHFILHAYDLFKKYEVIVATSSFSSDHGTGPVHVRDAIPWYLIPLYVSPIVDRPDGEIRGNYELFDDFVSIQSQTTRITDNYFQVCKYDISLWNAGNSAKSTLVLHLPQTQQVVVSLMNIKGQLIDNVFNGKLTKGENRLTIDLSNHRKGIYFLILQDGSTNKFAVEKFAIY